MHQGEYPTKQQGDRQHNKQVARVDSCRIGRHEYRKESDNSNQGSAEQRHCRLPPDSGHGFHAALSGFQIDQNTVYNDNRIIHQHSHGKYKGCQRYTLHRAVHKIQKQESAEHCHYQTDSDNHPALESHCNHQDDNYNNHGFYQIQDKCPQRTSDTFGLIEYLVAFHSCRQAFGFQLFKFLLHPFADFDNIGIGRGGNHDSHGTLTIIEQFVAGGVFVVFFNAGDVAQTQLVGIVSLNQHTSDVFHRLEFIADRDPDTAVTVVVIAGIGCFILSVQGGKHFGRFHTQVGHSVLQ